MKRPKVIHYCWFGEQQLPEREMKCIESWRKWLPDYEIKKWNENNFDYKQCTFARQAYERRQYAFVSDYARAKILYEQGGIYFDTDVEVLKKIPAFIIEKNFMGFERKAFVGTAILAVEPGNESIRELLDYYENHDFVQKDGTVDQIANVSVLTDIMKKKGLVLGGKRQRVDGIEVFNREVFYPKKISETEFRVTEETLAIHLCSNSWMSEREKRRGNSFFWTQVVRPFFRGIRRIGICVFGKEKIRKLEIKVRSRLR